MDIKEYKMYSLPLIRFINAAIKFMVLDDQRAIIFVHLSNYEKTGKNPTTHVAYEFSTDSRLCKEIAEAEFKYSGYEIYYNIDEYGNAFDGVCIAKRVLLETTSSNSKTRINYEHLMKYLGSISLGIKGVKEVLVVGFRHNGFLVVTDYNYSGKASIRFA